MASSVNFESNAQSTSNTPVSFAAQGIGTAAADRHVHIGVMAGFAGVLTTQPISSVTVDGITATQNVQNNTGGVNGVTVGLFTALVPSNTTATIVVTYAGTVSRSAIGVWSSRGISTNSAIATGSHMATDPAVVALNPIFADGFVIAVAMENNTCTFSWTNVTERFDTTVDGAGHSGGENSSPGTSLTVTADYSLTDARCGMVAAAWGNSLPGGVDTCLMVHP